MYTIKCDGYILDDPRDDRFSVESPKVDLEVNTVGSASFTIYNNHPHFDKLKKLKSVFEVADEIGVVFRGRMTEHSADFNNAKDVDLEGAMAYFNDSTVRPYVFPDDFLEDADYITAAESGNVIEFFLNWLIEQHNSQVDEFQRFKLGNVTVSDPNNYLSREDSKYPTTWEVLKSKLFDSALGGYLCIRYEEDGNYIDYLSEFTLTNTQEIVFGENLLDLKSGEDATATYSAVIPIGATIETETTDDEGNTETTKTLVTLESLDDGEITDDIVKQGDMLYSKSAREAHGLICAPVKDTTWDDVTEAENLLTKGVTALETDLTLLTNTVEATAVDLHFTDEQVRSFRIYRNVKVRSDPHGHKGLYQLPKLGLDLHNPQNTKITVGTTKRTLTDINSEKEAEASTRIESAEKDIADNRTNVTEVRNQVVTQSTELINTCNEIIMGALKSYVETSNYNEFKQTTESQLKLLSDALTLKFTEAISRIESVDGDLQEKYNTITKYFVFDIDGLTIGQSDSPYKVVIDNDKYSMYANGQEVMWIKDGEVHTPDSTITRRFNLLGYSAVMDEKTGVVNCDWSGIPVYIVQQPDYDIAQIEASEASLSIVAVGDGLTYQWQVFESEEGWWTNLNDGGNDFANTPSMEVTGCNQAICTLSIDVSAGWSYEFRCVVNDEYGNQVVSNTATITVTEE